jgi:hypothetical protein
LQPRDYTLALLLDEHRVLTPPQIAAVLFTSPRTCRNRLDTLRRLGFLDRFIPTRPGARPPVHWVPGPLAARYAALSRGERPPTPKKLRERQDAILASLQLDHTVGPTSSSWTCSPTPAPTPAPVCSDGGPRRTPRQPWAGACARTGTASGATTAP